MPWYKKEPIKTFISQIADEYDEDEEEVIKVLDCFFKSILNNLVRVEVFKLPHFGKISTIAFKKRKQRAYMAEAVKQQNKDVLSKLEFDFNEFEETDIEIEDNTNQLFLF